MGTEKELAVPLKTTSSDLNATSADNVRAEAMAMESASSNDAPLKSVSVSAVDEGCGC